MTLLKDAKPYPVRFETDTTALLLIDMQRDFLEPGGFGEMLGNDVSLLRGTIEPCSWPLGPRTCWYCIPGRDIGPI